MYLEPIVRNEILTLKTEGDLHIVWLGTGAAFTKDNNETNLILIKGDDHVVIDFGTLASNAIWEIGKLYLHDLKTFLPTHSHADHVGGLEKVALYNRYVAIPRMNKSKVRMIVDPSYEEILWDRTLRGGLEWNEEGLNGARMNLRDYFDIIRPKLIPERKRETWEVNVGGIHLEIFRTRHYPGTAMSWEDAFRSVGILVDHRVFISMDTMFDEDLIDTYKDAEILFHDVCFCEGNVHAPLSKLKELDPEIKRKMKLIHLPDNWYEYEREIRDSGFRGVTKKGERYVFE